MAPRASGFLALLLAMTAVAGAAGCGETTAASPSPATLLSSPSASAVGGSWARVQSAHATAFSHSAEPFTLPFREYRRPGSWRVPDLTDRTAVLMRNVGENQELWLMDLSNGRTRQIFARATDARPGFWIGSVHLSDGWLVWEEVGRGDDLAESVDWKLYAAPLDRDPLTAGKPLLVASASNTEASRPLFDVSGSRLAWVSTAWASQGTAARSQLTVRDLASGRRLVSYRPQGVLDTVNLRGDQAIVGETPQLGARATLLKVLDLASGDLAAGFEVESEHSLSHWPAWREGWLAWAPFPAREATYPYLYMRDPSGHISTEGGSAVDPCFVGPYLFYQTRRPGRPYEGDTAEVRALRLRDMTSLVLESGKPDDNDWWHGVVGAPDLSRTYVTYLDRALFAEKDSDRYTIIRVYRVA
jgi:hypothetical protein